MDDKEFQWSGHFGAVGPAPKTPLLPGLSPRFGSRIPSVRPRWELNLHGKGNL